MDCGPTCLQMICRYHGRQHTLAYLRKRCFGSRSGVSLFQLSNAATDIGFRTLYAKISFEDLDRVIFPCVVHWTNNHFVVVYEVGKKKVVVGDPAIGIISYTHQEFIERWIYKTTGNTGIILLMEPTPKFYTEEEKGQSYIGFSFFMKYLRPFRQYYFQVFLGMFVSMGFALLLPFLTQSVIDVGINNKNLGYIKLVLAAQIMFSVSNSVLTFLQNWIFLHVSSRINIAIISDYLIKLLRLPISFFDSKMAGDIMQRINDHSRIQSFISSATLSTLFSFINFFVFSFIMAYYSITIFVVFLCFSIAYAIWASLFLKKRKEFDYKYFEKSSIRQNSLLQLIYGIKDIKLNNYEDKKRWEWERIQVQTLKINIRQLVLSQYQQGGAIFIEVTKGIVVSYLSAKLVIDGSITLGMMLSMQYILGQINAPISQLIGLINSYQDAKISLERIGEIHETADEEASDQLSYGDIPENRSIRFDQVSYAYNGSPDKYVIRDVSFEIPENRTTAIVGASGSGKTTLLKLLLKFDEVQKGRIFVGKTDLKNISHKAWRSTCGAVLQDSYIFSDSVAENIAVGDEGISLKKLEYAAGIANIADFITDLPQAYNTKIGVDGIGVSQGQKQRILIARAIYKSPEFIFLDEATNSLDSKNEGEIMDKLGAFFKGRTVVIVAHRLSTIRNADNIIVFDEGKVAESGRHEDLINKKGVYYELVRKQTQVLA